MARRLLVQNWRPTSKPADSVDWVQLNVGLCFRKSVDYIRHEEVTAEKRRLDLNNPRISIRGIWVDAFGFPRAEPWSPRFNCTPVDSRRDISRAFKYYCDKLFCGRAAKEATQWLRIQPIHHGTSTR
jgi:hypothetical protein